ncbi:MAG: IS200/IS605 family transposase [Thermomicrobiales bacterium]|nr:IS200/IS605 family transposase [Thermomicrobiales bacterium]
MSFWRLYYHLVWGTKHRHPTLEGEMLETATRSIRDSCTEMGLVFHALGIMPEHVHLVVGIPPRMAIADVVKQIKGSSSHLLNRLSGDQPWYGWQGEYGVMSFGERSLDRIVWYVEHQPEHHRTGDLMPLFERLETERSDSPQVETCG